MFTTLLYAAGEAAPAAGAAVPEAPSGLAAAMQFLPLVLIFVIFYFMFIMPARKEQKKTQEMLASLKEGDKVLTTGGIVGFITKMGDKDEVVQISAGEGVKINVMRAFISKKIEKQA
jgi:preprotein translocase subunit YajC